MSSFCFREAISSERARLDHGGVLDAKYNVCDLTMAEIPGGVFDANYNVTAPPKVKPKFWLDPSTCSWDIFSLRLGC